MTAILPTLTTLLAAVARALGLVDVAHERVHEPPTQIPERVPVLGGNRVARIRASPRRRTSSSSGWPLPTGYTRDCEAAGVLVRNMGGVIESALRVTVGTPEENSAFLDALRTAVGGAS